MEIQCSKCKMIYDEDCFYKEVYSPKREKICKYCRAECRKKNYYLNKEKKKQKEMKESLCSQYPDAIFC